MPTVGSEVQFNIGKSGGVSYEWDFGDGTPKVTTTDAVVSHTYDSAGTKTATLKVTYADGDTATKTVDAVNVPTPLFTNVHARRRGQRAAGAGADARPAGDLRQRSCRRSTRDYTASTTASVLATSGNAPLSVSDPSTTATGRLVNADYALPVAAAGEGHSAKGGGRSARRRRRRGDPDAAAELQRCDQRQRRDARVQAARRESLMR